MPPADYGPLSQADDGYAEEAPASSYTTASHLALPTSAARPPVYYGEEPFDPPSSESDEESEVLLEKPTTPGAAERAVFPLEDDGGVSGLFVGGKKKQQWSSIRWLVFSLVGLLLFAAIIGIFAGLSYHETKRIIRGHERLTMENVFNGTFRIERSEVNWVPEAGDGVFSLNQNGYISLVDLKTNTTTNLIATADIKDEDGRRLTFSSWRLSPNMKYMLVKGNPVQQWRRSSMGNYYIVNMETLDTHPLIPPSDPPVTAYATWAPVGETIALVTENDLYVLDTPSSDTPIPVTSSGNASLFHGVPDWVYEEEVLAADFALWWAPDGSKIVYLDFDETMVDEFTFPIYNPTQDGDAVIPYTSEVSIKYPKPGYPNPLVSVHIFDSSRFMEESALVGDATAEEYSFELDWDGRQPSNDSIITEVAWIGNSTLLLKETSRNSTTGSILYFELDDTTEAEEIVKGSAVRHLGKNGEQGDDGWIDAEQNIHPLPPSIAPDGAYLDIVSNKGYNHIALFSPANSTSPQFLTSGEWEVTEIKAVDTSRNLLYFSAATPSIERHLYSVLLPAGLVVQEEPEMVALTDTSAPGYFSTDFSPQVGFYLLNYQGPNIPWQRIISVGDDDFNFVLHDNLALNETWNKYETPIIQYTTIQSDGYELNAVEIRPPRMDDSGRTKYPVLFRVYGGPFSQTVNAAFNLDWHHYLAASLNYIVVVVDGRGTGYKGRQLRNPVRGNLGFYETIDQVNAARIWAAKEYVDDKRIGIWGWSYGGFMSSKVVEANAGIHSLAMAVAPVTSWRMYDSIYTERYMGLPAVNSGGYVNASISNVSGWNNVDYLLAHGSGDDNVHFANSAHLLDMFTKAHVRNFRFRMFTDSAHSMTVRGAYFELHQWMTDFLVEKWGKGARRRGW